MRYYLIFICLSTYFLISCSSDSVVEETGQEELYISLFNSIAQSRKNEPIVISRTSLETLTRKIPEGHIPRLIGENGEEIPLQTDDINGDGIWDEISFIYSILPKYTAVLKLETVELALSAVFQNNTNIVVYSSDNKKNSFSEVGVKSQSLENSHPISGIAWENDKIGFLLHFEPQPIKFILGKTTEEMILNKVNIHPISQLRGTWGRKFFNNYDSIGAGSLMIVKDSIATIIEDYDSLHYQIVTQGPVRSIIKIQYKGLQHGDLKFDLEEEITIWAKQDGYQNKISVKNIDEELILATALPYFSSNSFIHNEEHLHYYSLATFNIQMETTAFGLLLPKNKIQNLPDETLIKGFDKDIFYLNFKVKPQSPVILNLLAGWHYQDEKFETPEGFLTMLDKESNRLANPIEISNNKVE